MNTIFRATCVVVGATICAFAETTNEVSHLDIIKSLNPELSVVIDASYYHDSSSELSEIKESIPGFGHGHGEEEHGHGEKENGFNLSEVELNLGGEVDGYFRADATFSFTAEGAEIEVAEIRTTSLPWGLTLKGGRFFSEFGIINRQHPHQWQFSDQPLIYELALGEHGLNDVGVQAIWEPEWSFLFKAGAEAFQGDNEALFAHEGEGDLPAHDGPRLGVGWLKVGPYLGHEHNLQFGVSGGSGKHQETHEEVAGSFNYLDGDSHFVGLDLFYHYSAHGDRGQGDLTFQSEYFYRNKDLQLIASDDVAAPVGESLDSNQDGYYIQGLYGFLPRWRGGFRWDQVGLTNTLKEPGESEERFGDSWRATAMVDFSPSAASVIRLHVAQGDYETEAGRERGWETYLQVVFTLGQHSHHGGHICEGH